MQKGQYIALTIAAVFFSVLYFGFSNVAPHRKSIDQSREVTSTVTSAESLIQQATDALNPAQKEELRLLLAKDSSVSHLKQVSSWWVNAGKPSVAGIYAEQVAKKEATPEAWSIAGATFHLGINAETESEIARKYCGDSAKKAFESAISLQPNEPEHRVNLALIYADAPLKDDPMKAVMMLRDLEAKYPEEPVVYNALGRLAIKTAQWERALQRLEKALQLDAQNQNTICLLAVAYQGAGNEIKASEFARRCKQ